MTGTGPGEHRDRIDCVCVGSATRDVFVRTDESAIASIRRPHLHEQFLALPYGHKIEVDEVLFMTGGGATNVAAAQARLGLRPLPVAAVGRDGAAAEVRARLERDGVPTDGLVVSDEHPTAYSVILTSFAGDRTVLVHRGAGEHLEPDALPLERVAAARHLYVSSLGNASAQVHGPLFEAARAAGVPAAFNPGSQTVSRGLAEAAPWLDGLAVLVLNREEALAFLGRPVAERHSPEREELLYDELLGAFRGAGVTLPVITDGFRGCYALDGDARLHCPAPVVEAASTLGAGDAFGATLVAGLLRHGDVPRALREAVLNAASVVQVFGAKRGLLDADGLAAAARAPGAPAVASRPGRA